MAKLDDLIQQKQQREMCIRDSHCAAGVFGGELKCSGRLRVIPVEAVLNGIDDPRICLLYTSRCV